MIDPPLVLNHGAKRWVKLRQFLSKEVAQTLNDSKGVVKLDFSRVCITFAVTGHTTSAPTKFLWYGSDMTVAHRD